MASYSRISLNDLLLRMTERVGNNSTFWSSDEKKKAINEAIRVWAVMSGQWSRRIGLPTIAGQTFYGVPKQIVSVQRLRYDSTVLIQSAIAELDYGFDNWQGSATGTPQFWTPVGLDLIAIYPAAPAGHSLNFEGIMLAPALGTGGDNIDIGDEEVTRLLDYAHHYLTFKEGGSEFKATQGLYSNFVQAAAQRNSRILASSLFRDYLGENKDSFERPERSPESPSGARG